MKITSAASLLLISFTLSGFRTTDGPKLGKQIYEAINANDLEKVQSFIVTIRELEATVENSEMGEDEKADFIADFSSRLKSGKYSRDKKLYQVEKAFYEIRTNIENKQCKDGVILGEITSKTLKLRNHIEIGYLTINYSCKADSEAIKVTVIKTDFGWRIFERLRLVDK